MKKLSAAAVFLVLFILASCNGPVRRDDIPPYGQSSDGCIYFQDENLIKRLDPEIGRISVVCPDPVCEHDDDSCPAYGKSQLTVSGDTLYFMSSDNSHTIDGNILHMYDLAAGVDKIIYRSNGDLRYPREAYGYVYFSESNIEFDKDGEGGVTIGAESWNILRYDIAGGKVEKLNDEPLDGFLFLDDVRDGRLYFSSGGSGGYFSTDRDFSDKIAEDVGPLTFDGDAIEIIYDHPGIDPETGEPYGGKYYCLVRRDGESGEQTELFSGGCSAQFFSELGGYLFTTGQTRDGANELVFVSFDGEKRSIYKAEEGMVFSSGLAADLPGCDCRTDEYTFIRCHYKEDETAPDEDGNISISKEYILLINVATGECRIIDK